MATSPGGVVILKGAPEGGAESKLEGGADGGRSTAGGSEVAVSDAQASAASYEEFSPFELAQHAGRGVVRFASFSEAVDACESKKPPASSFWSSSSGVMDLSL